MYAKVVVLACFIAVAIADQKWHGPIAGGLPADLYPAGISPQACPNFPNCDNPAVALAATAGHAAGGAGGWNGAHAGGWNGAGAGGWNGAGAGAGGWNGGHNSGGWNGAGAGGWNGAGAGGWNGGHGNDGWNNHQNPLDRGEYIGDGDYHGEGLAESGAYGNGYHH